MARQIGLIQLIGTLDNINFYKTRDGILARMNTSVDKVRIATDPAFIRTRENAAEFGAAAKAGKALRKVLKPFLNMASDNRVTPRVVQVMTRIKNQDFTSSRGKRTVAKGIINPAAKALLKGFNFNEHSNLGSILGKPFYVTSANGALTVSPITPLHDIYFPPGATHVSFQCGWAKIDFAAGTGDLQFSAACNLSLDETTQDISLIPASAPTGPGIDLHLLCIFFYQEVNGAQYPLKNGAFNSLCIVEVH